MLKTRNKVINFRVTEEEFNRLMEASVNNGARCLSDFARTAILVSLEKHQTQSTGALGRVDKVSSLMRRIEALERSLAKLERKDSVHRSSERPEMSEVSPV